MRGQAKKRKSNATPTSRSKSKVPASELDAEENVPQTGDGNLGDEIKASSLLIKLPPWTDICPSIGTEVANGIPTFSELENILDQFKSLNDQIGDVKKQLSKENIPKDLKIPRVSQLPPVPPISAINAEIQAKKNSSGHSIIKLKRSTSESLARSKDSKRRNIGVSHSGDKPADAEPPVVKHGKGSKNLNMIQGKSTAKQSRPKKDISKLAFKKDKPPKPRDSNTGRGGSSTKTASAAKPNIPNQIAINVFWNCIDQYFKPIQEEHLKWLDLSSIDMLSEYLVIPHLGISCKGNPSQKPNDQVSMPPAAFPMNPGTLTSRLLAGLVESKLIAPQRISGHDQKDAIISPKVQVLTAASLKSPLAEDDNYDLPDGKDGSIGIEQENPHLSITMNSGSSMSKESSTSAINEQMSIDPVPQTEATGDSLRMNTMSPFSDNPTTSVSDLPYYYSRNQNLSAAIVPVVSLLDAKRKWVDVEERIRRDLSNLGVLPEGILQEGLEDDEVCGQLRQLQNQLRLQCTLNDYRKRRLLKSILGRCAAQEYYQAIDTLNKQIEAAWTRRTKQVKKKKRPAFLGLTTDSSQLARNPLIEDEDKVAASNSMSFLSVGTEESIDPGIYCLAKKKLLIDSFGDLIPSREQLQTDAGKSKLFDTDEERVMLEQEIDKFPFKPLPAEAFHQRPLSMIVSPSTSNVNHNISTDPHSQASAMLGLSEAHEIMARANRVDALSSTNSSLKRSYTSTNDISRQKQRRMTTHVKASEDFDSPTSNIVPKRLTVRLPVPTNIPTNTF
jgi:hypothetical protein